MGLLEIQDKLDIKIIRPPGGENCYSFTPNFFATPLFVCMYLFVYKLGENNNKNTRKWSSQKDNILAITSNLLLLSVSKYLSIMYQHVKGTFYQSVLYGFLPL
jgi:hypothetical protein